MYWIKEVPIPFKYNNNARDLKIEHTAKHLIDYPAS